MQETELIEQNEHAGSTADAMSVPLGKLLATLLCAIGCAIWAGSATASIYRGGFDPTDLMGYVDISVPTGCVNTDPGFNVLSAGTGVGECGPVDVLDATITSPSSITFGGSTNVVTQLVWQNGILDAISTDIFGPSSSPTGYFLQFGSSLSLDNVLTTSVTLFTLSCSTDGEDDEDGVCGYNTAATAAKGQLGFVRVPEPGSLALVLAALAIGGLVLRRRAAV